METDRIAAEPGLDPVSTIIVLESVPIPPSAQDSDAWPAQIGARVVPGEESRAVSAHMRLKDGSGVKQPSRKGG